MEKGKHSDHYWSKESLVWLHQTLWSTTCPSHCQLTGGTVFPLTPYLVSLEQSCWATSQTKSMRKNKCHLSAQGLSFITSRSSTLPSTVNTSWHSPVGEQDGEFHQDAREERAASTGCPEGPRNLRPWARGQLGTRLSRGLEQVLSRDPFFLPSVSNHVPAQ